MIRTGVSLVNLYATVRDKNRRILPDLNKEDFKVFEDEKEQKVEFFSKEVALPITLAMLIDTSGSMERVLRAEQQAGARFLRKVLRPKDMALVMSFDLDVDLLGDFSSDAAYLERALYRAKVVAPRVPGPVQGPFPSSNRGGTNFYDAIYLACKEKLAGEVGRKAIIAITDAADTGSKVKLEEALEAAQRTDTVVHVILLIDPYYGGNAGVAKRFAEQTGGRVIDVHNEKKIEEAFEILAEELRTQYTLGYYPSNSKRDGSFRKVRVDVTRDGAKVLTRKGYFAAAAR